MKKIILILMFTLATLDCFGLAQEARVMLNLNSENLFVDMPLEKFVVIIEEIEEIEQSIQTERTLHEEQTNSIAEHEFHKKILKINLTTEMKLLEKFYEFWIELGGNDKDFIKKFQQQLTIIRFIFEQAKQL